MKVYILLAALAVPASVTSMQQSQENQFLKRLDETSLNEFIETKKQIVAIAQNITDHKNNKLVSYYQAFSEFPPSQLGQILAQESMQVKVRELYNAVSAERTYQEALQKARHEKSNERWETFRQLNGKLLQKELSHKGVQHPEQDNTQLYLEINKELNPEAGAYAIAASYLIFHARQMQRSETGKPIPQLILN